MQFYILYLGYKPTEGISTISVQTKSAVYSSTGKDDKRFSQEMDDPNGENLDPVNSIISIPIIARKEFDKPNPIQIGRAHV